MRELERQPNERHLRERPPRKLNLFTKLTLLSAGVLNQIGWIVTGIGMFASCMLIPNSEIRYILSFDGNWEETTGKVRAVKEMNLEVNGQTMYAYEIEFKAEGELFQTHSYDYFNPDYREGATAPIEYKTGNPNRARILGMSSSAISGLIGFILIFPLLGLILLLAGIYRSRKALKLLQQGRFTRGTMLGKIETGARVNNRSVYDYEFQFEANGGRQFIAKCSTHNTHLVEDEESEIILYDPNDPDKNIVFDAVPGVPMINNRGELAPARPRKWLFLLAPAIGLGLTLLGFALSKTLF